MLFRSAGVQNCEHFTTVRMNTGKDQAGATLGKIKFMRLNIRQIPYV